MVECHGAARRQGTLRSSRWGGFVIGSPAYDPALCAAALEKSSRAAATGWSSLSANSTHNAMDSKISFDARIRALKGSAEVLRAAAVSVGNAAEAVMTEVLYMEAAQSRFAARKGEHRQTTRASR